MDVIKLNSAELLNYSVDNIINNTTFNNKVCGTGKTRYNHNVLKNALENGLKTIICLPDHSLIEEFKKYIDYDCFFFHMLGKTLLCRLDSLEDAYIKGCKKCSWRNACAYINQFKVAKKADVIFLVPQHLFLVKEFEPDVLIIDESIEDIATMGIKIPLALTELIKFESVKCVECPKWNDCKDWRKRFVKTHGCFFKMLKTIKLDKFEPETLEEYFFKYNMKHLKNVRALRDGKEYIIIGSTPLDFLQEVPTLLFNCATTLPSVAEKIFGMEFDQIIVDDEPLENEIIVINNLFSKNTTQEELINSGDYFNILNIDMEKTLIITKKTFEEDVAGLTKEHYGRTRGTNRYENLDTVVLFGRYGLRPNHEMLLMMRGFTEKEVKSFSQSEELQALHRIRPVLDKSKRIILFTNQLVSRLPDNLTIIDFYHLRLANVILQGNYVGLTKIELYKKIKGNNIDIKKAIDLLYLYGKIFNMDKRGSKLKIRKK